MNFKLQVTGVAAAAVLFFGGAYLLNSITTVPAGYVGVRVNLYADKGVDNEVVGTGRYFLGINELTQGGKTALLDGVLKELRGKLDPVGIRVVKLSWVTDLIYPEQVKESINAKIEATQRALLRENEVAQSKAEAQKRIEEARGIAESTRLRAQAEADAIAIKARALRDNPDVIQLNAIEKWDGKLPQMMMADAPMPLINVGK